MRPDAYTLLQAPTHADCWWLEVDNNTEALPRITLKCRQYADFLTSGGIGPDGAPPRVLFTAPDNVRASAIAEVIAKTSISDGGLIITTTHEQASGLLVTELANTE